MVVWYGRLHTTELADLPDLEDLAGHASWLRFMPTDKRLRFPLFEAWRFQNPKWALMSPKRTRLDSAVGSPCLNWRSSNVMTSKHPDTTATGMSCPQLRLSCFFLIHYRWQPEENALLRLSKHPQGRPGQVRTEVAPQLAGSVKSRTMSV